LRLSSKNNVFLSLKIHPTKHHKGFTVIICLPLKKERQGLMAILRKNPISPDFPNGEGSFLSLGDEWQIHGHLGRGEYS
jgi:hypothetical protein